MSTPAVPTVVPDGSGDAVVTRSAPCSPEAPHPPEKAPVWCGRNDGLILETLAACPDWFSQRVLGRVDGRPDPDGCWMWTGVVSKGQSQVRLPKAGVGERATGVSVRRVVHLALVGPIPQGHLLHYSCDNRLCVNPDHLVPMTFYTLVRQPEMRSVHAENAQRTHCRRGHALTPENNLPFLAKQRWRGCHTCLRETQAIIRRAVQATGLTWTGYAAQYGLSRVAALSLLNAAGQLNP